MTAVVIHEHDGNSDGLSTASNVVQPVISTLVDTESKTEKPRVVGNLASANDGEECTIVKSLEEGWSKVQVKTKSDKQASRQCNYKNSHQNPLGGDNEVRRRHRQGHGGNHSKGYFKGAGNQRPSTNGKAKQEQVFPTTGTVEQPQANGMNAESHSSTESTDSDSKKSDSEKKEKLEYIAAPAPKVNPWQKDEFPIERICKGPGTKQEKSEQLAVKENKKDINTSGNCPPEKSSKLPQTFAWGKSNTTLTSSIQETDISRKVTSTGAENSTEENKENRDSKENQGLSEEKSSHKLLSIDQKSEKVESWPSLVEAVSPLQTKTPAHKQVSSKPTSHANYKDNRKFNSKKYHKHHDDSKHSQLPQTSADNKKDDDSDSSKENIAGGRTSPNTSNSKRKGKRHWVPLPVDVNLKRGGNSTRGRRGVAPANRNLSRGADSGRRSSRTFNNSNNYGSNEGESSYQRWPRTDGRKARGMNRGRGRNRGGSFRGNSKSSQHGHPLLTDEQGLVPPTLMVYDPTAFVTPLEVVPPGALIYLSAETTTYIPNVEDVRLQMEYYFSEENLQGDFYLRQHMDMDGFISVNFLASFNRLQKLTTDLNLIYRALEESAVVELIDDKVRCSINPHRWVIPKTYPDANLHVLETRKVYPVNYMPYTNENEVSLHSSYIVNDKSLSGETGETLTAETMRELAACSLLSAEAPGFLPRKSFKQTQYIN